jgi:hypothetical protein
MIGEIRPADRKVLEGPSAAASNRRAKLPMDSQKKKYGTERQDLRGVTCKMHHLHHHYHYHHTHPSSSRLPNVPPSKTRVPTRILRLRE